MTESGELLTLHRQGSGFGPGGWVLRRAIRCVMRSLCGNERPQVVAQGIRLGISRLNSHSVIVCAYYAAFTSSTACSCMDATRGGNRLFGPLAMAASDPLTAELRQFRHCFQAALNGVKPTGGTGWVKAPD
ncbi:hypothetical protein ACVXG9_23715 [Escherichia coli]